MTILRSKGIKARSNLTDEKRTSLYTINSPIPLELMIRGHHVVAVIPARGGSKSVPDKNIRPLAGKPLIAWAIDVAQSTEGIDRVLVSTDSEKIGRVAQAYGAEIAERPAELATDSSLIIDTIRHLISELRARGEAIDILVLLEPTSPLRSPEDVEACLQLLTTPGREYDCVATFAEARVNPHRTWKIENNEPRTFIPGAIPWLPRQQLPAAYQLNGGAIAFFVDRLPSDGISLVFGKTAAVVMPKERSVDIDSELDLALANAMLEARLQKASGA